MDRLNDFKLRMRIVIKADRDWRGVQWPQVANCNASQLSHFLVLILLAYLLTIDNDIAKFRQYGIHILSID